MLNRRHQNLNGRAVAEGHRTSNVIQLLISALFSVVFAHSRLGAHERLEAVSPASLKLAQNLRILDENAPIRLEHLL